MPEDGGFFHGGTHVYRGLVLEDVHASDGSRRRAITDVNPETLQVRIERVEQTDHGLKPVGVGRTVHWPDAAGRYRIPE